jgi:hypothetical protein
MWPRAKWGELAWSILPAYARNDARVRQIIEGPGLYNFAMSLLTARREGYTFFGGVKSRNLTFEMNLPYMDHRAFTSGGGTLPLHHPHWQPSSNGLSASPVSANPYRDQPAFNRNRLRRKS